MVHLSTLALPPGLDVPGLRVPPQHLWVPEHVAAPMADEAVDLMATVGRDLDAEQELALRAIYAETADGHHAALVAAIIACRQNIKTYTLEAAGLTDLYLGPPGSLLLWTAHLFSTTQEAFRNLKALIDNHDHLRRMVKRITTGNGDEGIELLNGTRQLFRARSENAARGLSGDVVLLDEGFAVTEGQMGSLMPTLSARPNPQVRLGSSAGKPKSNVLRRYRNRGRKGGDPGLAWVEWCAPGSWEEPGCGLEHCQHAVGTPHCTLDDPEHWQAANPTMRRRITEAFVAEERRSMSVLEFGRERMGWWDDPLGDVGELAIDEAQWATRAMTAEHPSYPVDPVAMAIDVTPRSTSSAVAIAGWRPQELDTDPDGLLRTRKHLEVMATGDGVSWVIDYVVERVMTWRPVAVALDGSSPAAALLPGLRRALVDAGMPEAEVKALILVLGAREVAASCGMLDTDVREDGARHAGQTELTTAVGGATWRALAGARAFARLDSEVDISPLVAVAGAGYALVARRPVVKPPPAEPRSVPRLDPPTVEGRTGSGDGAGGLDVMSTGF